MYQSGNIIQVEFVSINLAHMQKYDDASISEIFKKYGVTIRDFDG